MAQQKRQTLLPQTVIDYIDLVIKKMRYRKSVRADVRCELIAHFTDALKDCETDEEKSTLAEELIAEFGQAAILAKLIRRGKKRCRPLWRTIVARGFQAIGLIILYIIARVIFLSVGSPSVNVNYIEWLNEHVTASIDKAENAKVYYDKAAALSVKIPSEIAKKRSYCSSKGPDNSNWLDNFTEEEIELLAKSLDENKEALEALREGSRKPYCWPVYDSQKSGPIQDSIMGDVLESLSKYKVIARAMAWQIAYDAYRGRVGDALSNCQVLQRCAMHLQGKGLLIEQLVGIAIEGMGNARAFDLIAREDIPIDMLKGYYAELENLFIDTGAVINWEAEKALWYDLIQRRFTDDGKGNGRVLKNGLPLVVKDVPSSLMGFFFWNYPDRRQVVSTIDRYYDQVGKVFSKSPYELHQKRETNVWEELGKEIFMLKITGPAYSKISEISGRLKTARLGLSTVVAVLLYQKEKGGYPADLDELVSKSYLKNLPMDPYSDNKPLVYKKTTDSFILYSFGLNCIDDGGEPGRDSKGDIEQWADEGDTILWPVPN